MAVFTVPNDKLIILTQKEGEEILKKINSIPPLTPEERSEIKEKARKLRQKPEKKQYMDKVKI